MPRKPQRDLMEVSLDFLKSKWGLVNLESTFGVRNFGAEQT